VGKDDGMSKREHTSEFKPTRGHGYYQTSMALQTAKPCRTCKTAFMPKSARALDCEKCRKAKGNNGRWV
jgi:hypothetical protein